MLGKYINICIVKSYKQPEVITVENDKKTFLLQEEVYFAVIYIQ